MTLSKKYSSCISIFRQNMPHPKTELHYSSDFELLVAVILSAQCTDKRVNLITPALFNSLPNVSAFADSSVEIIFSFIKSCSYPNNKAKHLLEMSKVLVQKWNGQIPKTISELEDLPGVGRKTANVILSVLFNQPTMPVDTHVFRVSQRIGLAPSSKNPIDVEKILLTYTPPKNMHDMHHWLILHGRYVCKAKKPLCAECCVKNECDYFRDNTSKDLSSLNF